jgi:hypothetical protein
MSSRFDKMIKDFVSTIKENEKTIGPYDTVATVVRIEDDIAFVHIPGGIDETPVSKTVNCKVGDEIQIRVGGGRAWIVGNATSPPTDDTTANTAIRKANRLGDSLTKLQKIAGNTDQYFWHVETGEDTGSHITEIPKERFLEAPALGGGNLLLRSNGIAIRDGLNELATFSSTAIQFNQPGTSTVVATIGTSGLYIQKGVIKLGNKTSASDITNSGFYVDGNGNVACSNLLAHGGKIGGWNIGGSTFYAYGNENGSCSAADALGYTYVQGAPGTNLGNTVISVRTRTAAERTAGTDFSYQFYVDYKGYLYAKNANIKGTITATGGTIGGWTINEFSLSRGNLGLDSSGLGMSTSSASSGAYYYMTSAFLWNASYNTSITPSQIQITNSAGTAITTINSGSLSVYNSSASSIYSFTGSAKINLHVAASANRGIYDDTTLNSNWIITRFGSGSNAVGVYGNGIYLYNYYTFDGSGKVTGYRWVRYCTDDNGHDVWQPQDANTVYNGTTTRRWQYVYSNYVVGSHAYSNDSDLKKKDIIPDYDWKVDEFIQGLNPIAFTWKNDESETKKISYGFGAQDVHSLTDKLGLDNLNLYDAKICYEDEGRTIEQDYHGEEIEDEKLEWTLAYSELIAPMVLEIQRLMHRVDELEARLNG